jgi:hypothetical protein
MNFVKSCIRRTIKHEELRFTRVSERKAVVLQFEKPGWIVEGFERSSELGG